MKSPASALLRNDRALQGVRQPHGPGRQLACPQRVYHRTTRLQISLFLRQSARTQPPRAVYGRPLLAPLAAVTTTTVFEELHAGAAERLGGKIPAEALHRRAVPGSRRRAPALAPSDFLNLGRSMQACQ